MAIAVESSRVDTTVVRTTVLLCGLCTAAAAADPILSYFGC